MLEPHEVAAGRGRGGGRHTVGLGRGKHDENLQISHWTIPMSSSLGKCPSQHTSAQFGVRHSTEVRGVAPSLLPARPESVRSGERRADWLRPGAQLCDWLRHEMKR